jgi:hypothetical protein
MQRKSLTVDAGHPNVGKHKIKMEIADHLKGFCAVACLRDFIALLRKKRLINSRLQGSSSTTKILFLVVTP